METPAVHSGISALNATVNPYLAQTMTPQAGDSVNPMQTAVYIAAVVWLCGVAGMLLYALFGYIRISLRVREAVRLQDNIYMCDRIATPFIFGMFRPRVYLPSAMRAEDREYVLAHEAAHLSRRDHIIKPLGFLLLSVYWFHPLVWVAYLLFCRDIELACDERVIRTCGTDAKKPYADALITASASRDALSVCPLAFGETGVRGRIKAVLQYKKPAFWLMVVSVAACIALVVTFLTNPKQPYRSDKNAITGTVSAAEYDNVAYEYLSGSVQNKEIRVRWTNNTDKTLCFGTPFTLDKYGTTCTPNRPIGFDDLLHTVQPGKSFTETYDLSAYDLTRGNYRLAKTFFMEGAAEETYTAYVQFVISETYAFVGVQYEAETIVYDDERYAFTLSVDEAPPQFYVGDEYLSLVTNVLDGYQVTNMMGQKTLTKENFDDILTFGWKDGISAKTLREQNRLALEVQDNSNGHFLLLEQKNGDVYIGAGKDGIRWIFKVRKAEQAKGTLPRGELPLISGNVVLVNDAALSRAREKYPQFFNVDTSAGLIVDVWQMRAGDCRCYLTSAALDAVSDNSFAYDVGVSIPEMRAILSTYDIPEKDITIRAAQNPLSSYAYTIDEQYKAQLQLLFKRVGVMTEPKAEDLIAQAEVDIDRNGKKEHCTLQYGPTSGLYSFYLTVDDTMYFYYGSPFVAGFGTNAKGQAVILQKNAKNEKTDEIVMTLQDGKVTLVGGNDLMLGGETKRIPADGLFR